MVNDSYDGSAPWARVPTIRAMDRVRDEPGVRALDTSFTTPSVYELVIEERRIELHERVLPEPLLKRYPMEDAFASWAPWKTAWVAELDGICGFAAVDYEPWHRRLVLWHLYVASPHRRRGTGRALLAAVEAYGRKRRAANVRSLGWDLVSATEAGLSDEVYGRSHVNAYSLCGHNRATRATTFSNLDDVLAQEARACGKLGHIRLGSGRSVIARWGV